MCPTATKIFRQGVSSLNPQSRLQPPLFNAEVLEPRSGKAISSSCMMASTVPFRHSSDAPVHGVWPRQAHSTWTKMASISAEDSPRPSIPPKWKANFDQKESEGTTASDNRNGSRSQSVGDDTEGPTSGRNSTDNALFTSSVTTKSLTHYGLLGIAPSATKDEIRRAFLHRAMTYHPDVANAETTRNAVEQFQAIQRAYSILNDPELRRRYDQTIRGLPDSGSIQESRREFWRQWYRDKRDDSRRYTGDDSSSIFEQAGRSSETEYQLLMATYYRKMVRRREERRIKSYREAQARYSARLEEVPVGLDDQPRQRLSNVLSHRLQEWMRRIRASACHHIQEWSGFRPARAYFGPNCFSSERRCTGLAH